MKVEIWIPEHLSEITLGQYQKFEKLNTDENKESAFLLQKMVEIFCKLNLQDVLQIKVKSLNGVVAHLNNIFEKEYPLVNKFSLHGVEYGFIPVLDDMTLGEYIDLDSSLNDWQDMHKAMSILYRPRKFQKRNKYQVQDYKGIENAEVFKEMPLDITFGAMVFFWSLKNELLVNILNYLQKGTRSKLTYHQQEILEQSGVGINQSMDLLRAMLPSLIRLPN